MFEKIFTSKNPRSTENLSRIAPDPFLKDFSSAENID